uniref:phosphoribosylglycinamide formyltransferase 1 n=1 Tax=Ditylenchus dipsaci TaxID=166011 RepID=A0A915DTW3_9BILA
MILVVSPDHAPYVQQQLQSCYAIGHVCGLNSRSSRVEISNVDHLFSQFHFNASLVHRKRVNVGILISGSGSNMARLIHESRRRNSHCHVSVVIANKIGVLGLEVARELGVEAVVIPHGNSRPEFERKITKELEERGVELICLAGFMRVLTAEFVNRWREKVINIHPSLLPSFKGAQAVPLALEAGVKITGCTVHLLRKISTLEKFLDKNRWR